MFPTFATRALVQSLGASLAILAERTKDGTLRILAASPDTTEPLEVLRERWSAHMWMERALVDDGADVGLLVLVLEGPLAPAGSDLVELATASAAVDIGKCRRRTAATKGLEHRLVVSERMASMGTLAAGVAHEINNPLAYVKANVEHVLSVLRDTAGTDSDTIAALEDAYDGTERVRDIVHKLQTFSRSETVERASVDVERVIDSALAIAGNDIRHRAKLTKVFRHPPPVRANEASIGHVVLNLVLNAVQSMPEGASESNTLRVETGLDASGHVFIDVTDTGSGIPADVMDRIFDPFFTTKPIGVGSGLGLAIVHSIVTSAGGEITVESTMGFGSVFRVTLPRDPLFLPASRPSRRSTSSDRKPGVLVIDDDPRIATVLRRTLGRDHHVEIASGGRDAIERLSAGDRTPFDVILCDVMMPDVTGGDVHDWALRHRPDLAKRFVFMTGGAFTTRAQEFIMRTRLPLLAKPFSATDIRQLVANLMDANG